MKREDCAKTTEEPMRFDITKIACEELFYVWNVIIVLTTSKK